MSAPIEAGGLHTYYGASHVLHGVDLSLARGETLALLGRNGMGKTTLLRSLIGLTPPRRGSLRIAGNDMTTARPDRIARAGIAYVPEGRGIFPTLSVRENLLLAARPGDWNFDRVLAAFPRLAQRLDHGGGQISGGEQQMLAIGRALLTNPMALLLDEATEGLAPLIARDIWSMVATIRAGGIATIIVDRNLAALSALADRMIILAKGLVVFSGTPAELQSRPDLKQRHLGI
ncbi:MAG TPA: ABC transporter ATP-binding protein [Stellaceae bacterium]|nr:ABC transporter ATP-binding protein [Stellaceae bacterium]